MSGRQDRRHDRARDVLLRYGIYPFRTTYLLTLTLG